MEYPEYNNFSALQHKLDDFLAERHLTGFLQTEQYPITYTIRSNRDLDAQLSMIEEADSGIFGQDAQIIFVFRGEDPEQITSGRTCIPTPDLNKIKNLVKKLHYAFLQIYYLDTEKKVQLAEVRAREEITDRIHPIYEVSVGTICLLDPAMEE